MAKINKVNNGLIFYEDFSEKTLLWTLSPSNSDCVSFGENGLQMKHTKDYTTYTIVEPSIDEYSCIVELDHVPYNLKDIAGILVMSNTKEYAECQSFMALGPSEMTNAEIVNVDVERMVNNYLNDSYVQWSIDPELENDETTSTKETFKDVNTITELEYQDTLYKYIKFTKTKYKYVFYASNDAKTWIEIGNVKFADSGVIGFFIYGTDDEEILNNSHCFFKSLAIYNNRYIKIHRVNRNLDMEIYDEDGTILMRTDSSAFTNIISRSEDQCIINTMSMPMPIKNPTIKIYEKGNYEKLIGIYPLGECMYGGDEFILERDMKLFIENQEINSFNLYELGTFYNGSHYIKLDIYNNDEYTFNDVKIRVLKYSEYYTGEEPIKIALFDESKHKKDLTYVKELIIDSIAPSEGRSIILKLTEKPTQNLYSVANDYRFKIFIE